MKIRAVRVREVGVFRDAVAVEGFSGGLDVLAGANELGKSTLLRALERLFFVQPSSKSRDVEQLRPHGGGAPLIEADFEVAGKRWRLRKQFLTGKGSAELTDLCTGRVTERGPDAHARALALLGISDDKSRGPLGLLWVAQDQGPRPHVLGTDEQSLVLAAIGAEVTDVAAGHTLRAMQTRIGQELDGFLTDKTRKPKGAFDAALKARARASDELAAAEVQARRAAARHADYDRLRARHAELADPRQLAGRAQSVENAHAAVERGREAREKHKLAFAAQSGQESRYRRVADAVTGLRARVTERAKLGADLDALRVRIATTGALEAAAAQTVAAALEVREACERDLAQAQAALRERERRDEIERLRTQLDEGRAAQAERAGLATDRAAIAATEALVRKAEAGQRAIDALSAQLNAAAPVVAVAYAAGITGAIRAGGVPVAAGIELRPTSPLVLDIAGIGQITITPASASIADLADAAADLQAHCEELAATLAAMRVGDLGEARASLTRRRDLDLRFAVVESRLTAVAPLGLAVLEARLEAASHGPVEALREEAPPGKAEIAAQVIALEAARRAALHAFETAAREAAVHARHHAGLRATAEAAIARIEALDAHAAENGTPADQLASLELEAADATAALHQAVREAAAWKDTAPGEEAWKVLQDAATDALEARARAADERAGVERELARIEGELAHGGEGDLAERIDELAGAVAAATAQVAYFESEKAALTLLWRLIEEQQASAQADFLQPVLARVEPYLHQVLPDARLHLTDAFAPAALARGGAPEQTATLSGGTQEQLAVLTRLGFGRLLADRGRQAPVILDDALVYADDSRIERLFAVLREAARHHQVVVLTCRSRLFADLGGTALAIEPWAVPPS